MSKLIDKLNQISRIIPQPMGFRAAQTNLQKPKLLLIASLTEANVNDPVNCLNGADAGLLRVSEIASGTEAVSKICQALPDIPIGGWLNSISNDESEKVEQCGSDFVVFQAANSSLGILQRKGIGKIMQVAASTDEGLLAAVDELPVDAVLITTEPDVDFITWHDLMMFQYCAGVLTKPLLVVISANLETDELQAIWDAGINGIVVDAGENLSRLRQTIDNMNFPPQRKRGTSEAIVPRTSSGDYVEDEEDDDY